MKNIILIHVCVWLETKPIIYLQAMLITKLWGNRGKIKME